MAEQTVRDQLAVGSESNEDMDTITIQDPQDRSYPFGRNLFEDRTVLYQGTWSVFGHQE